MKSLKRILVLFILALTVAGCTPSYTSPNPPRATKGSAQAQVVVEEFADFQCPACAQASTLFSTLQEKYGERVLWKYYHFPLLQIHPYAFNAAMAAECANDQGKFWEMHDTLYANQKNLTRRDLYQYADNLNLDGTLFQACVKSRAKAQLVQEDMAEGERRKVSGTPTVFLNGALVSDWSQLDSRLSVFFTAAEGAE